MTRYTIDLGTAGYIGCNFTEHRGLRLEQRPLIGILPRLGEGEGQGFMFWWIFKMACMYDCMCVRAPVRLIFCLRCLVWIIYVKDTCLIWSINHSNVIKATRSGFLKAYFFTSKESARKSAQMASWKSQIFLFLKILKITPELALCAL